MSITSLAGSRDATLVQALWPTDESRLTRNVLLVIAGSLAMTISAKTQVPFYPVPMTMQTFVALVIGMAYGWRLGGLTVFFYLAQGAIGWPVFANTPERGIGIPYMMGPTGGFLMGFLAAAIVVGWLAERGWDRSVLRAALAMFAGHVVIFALGLAWLGGIMGYGMPLLEAGLIPFLWAALFKLALAAAVLPLAWRLAALRRQDD